MRSPHCCQISPFNRSSTCVEAHWLRLRRKDLCNISTRYLRAQFLVGINLSYLTHGFASTGGRLSIHRPHIPTHLNVRGGHISHRWMRRVRRAEEDPRAEPRGAEDRRRIFLSVGEGVGVDPIHRYPGGEADVERLSRQRQNRRKGAQRAFFGISSKRGRRDREGFLPPRKLSYPTIIPGGLNPNI